MEQEQFRQENKEVVFDRHWFNKHQSKLLWLANSFLGKYIFKFKKMGHYLDKDKKISKITPYSVAQFNGYKKGKAEFTEHFFTRNEYARKLYFYLYPLWLAMHIWDWFVSDHFTLAPNLSFGFSTLTQNPGTIGTHNPDDGSVQYSPADTTWANIQGGPGNVVQASSTSNAFASVLTLFSGLSSPKWATLVRGIFLFDTSSLTSGATITATVLSLFGKAKLDQGSLTPNYDIYTATPASTSSLANGDYTQTGTTSQTGSPVTYSNLSTTAYVDFTFNSTGMGNVSKTGISKFGGRNANYDVANSAPTWPGSNQISFWQCYFAFNGSNKPKLVVTYTLPAPSKMFLELLSSY